MPTSPRASSGWKAIWAAGPREPGRFDLVSCLYVHVAGSVVEMVRRLGAGVAPGGTMLLVGHRPIDPETGAPTPAAGQVQVSVAEAVEALDPDEWQIVVAEERPRAVAGTGVDAVVRAVPSRDVAPSGWSAAMNPPPVVVIPGEPDAHPRRSR